MSVTINDTAKPEDMQILDTKRTTGNPSLLIITPLTAPLNDKKNN
jgi:hypothetical protein